VTKKPPAMRVDPSDGKAYPFASFRKVYGKDADRLWRLAGEAQAFRARQARKPDGLKKRAGTSTMGDFLQKASSRASDSESVSSEAVSSVAEPQGYGPLTKSGSYMATALPARYAVTSPWAPKPAEEPDCRWAPVGTAAAGAVSETEVAKRKRLRNKKRRARAKAKKTAPVSCCCGNSAAAHAHGNRPFVITDGKQRPGLICRGYTPLFEGEIPPDV
jgi:hypothetical protein